MTNDLVAADDLAGFPGAPFADEIVESAVAELRARTGWHIAPSRTETITLDGDGGPTLMLPSMQVTAVSGIRNVYNSANPVDITADFRWSRAGVLSCPGLPYGFQAIEVDITHGYESCPLDLLPVIVALMQTATTDATVSQRAAGPFSETLNYAALGAWMDRSAGLTLSRYTIPPRP